MDTLPDNLTTEEFIKLGELHEQYEISINLVRYHKMINSSVEIVKHLIENMTLKKKELNDFTQMIQFFEIFNNEL